MSETVEVIEERNSRSRPTALDEFVSQSRLKLDLYSQNELEQEVARAADKARLLMDEEALKMIAAHESLEQAGTSCPS